MESKKWVGTTAAYFPAARAEETWAVAGDFCAAHKWMQLDTCRRVEGEENKPGCVRFCGSGERWVKERLVAFDPAGRSYSYEIVDGNLGLSEYLGTIRVVPAGEEGCRVEWSFESFPAEGRTYDGFVARLQAKLEALEKAVLLNGIK